MININDDIISQLLNHYDFQVKILGKNKVWLGDKENKVCRYCGKKSPEVKFSSIAHAFPELIGNKLLFTNYECDECNKNIFSKLENSLGNFTQFFRTATQFKGKRGFTSINDKANGFSFQTLENGQILIKEEVGKRKVELHPNKKEFTVHHRIDSYVPIEVHKAFVKMALSILSDDEITDFKDTIDWIMSTDHRNPIWLGELPLFIWFVPGNGFPKINFVKALRKGHSLVPHYLFAIAYKNFMFQVYVPFSRKDKASLMFQLPNTLYPIPVPHLFSDEYILRDSIQLSVNQMNSFQSVKGRPISMTYSYGELSEIKNDNELLKNIFNDDNNL